MEDAALGSPDGEPGVTGIVAGKPNRPTGADRARTGGTPFRKEVEKMEPILKSLECTAERLNATADHANEVIRAVNGRLQQMGVGVEFWFDEIERVALRIETPAPEPTDESDETPGRISQVNYVLGYAKVPAWQLAVQAQRYVPDPDAHYSGAATYDCAEQAYPLLSADREMRIKAAALLPEFLAAFTKHLEQLASKLPASADGPTGNSDEQQEAPGNGAERGQKVAVDPRVPEHFHRREKGLSSPFNA